MSEPPQHDIFISYSSADRHRVLPIAEHLKRSGLRVWLDIWAVLPGADIRQKVVTALGDSRRVLFCISPASLRSEWNALEKSIVLFKDPNNRQRRLIPLLLEPCQLPEELAHLEFIDGRDITPFVLEEIERHCTADAATQAESVHSPADSLLPVLPEIHNILNGGSCTGSVFTAAAGLQSASGTAQSWTNLTYDPNGMGRVTASAQTTKDQIGT